MVSLTPVANIIRRRKHKMAKQHCHDCKYADLSEFKYPCSECEYTGEEFTKFDPQDEDRFTDS